MKDILLCIQMLRFRTSVQGPDAQRGRSHQRKIQGFKVGLCEEGADIGCCAGVHTGQGSPSLSPSEVSVKWALNYVG